MASSEATEHRVYSGHTNDDVEAAYEADAQRMAADGFEAVETRWDESEPWPTLFVTYAKTTHDRDLIRSLPIAMVVAILIGAPALVFFIVSTDRDESSFASYLADRGYEVQRVDIWNPCAPQGAILCAERLDVVLVGDASDARDACEHLEVAGASGFDSRVAYGDGGEAWVDCDTDPLQGP